MLTKHQQVLQARAAAHHLHASGRTNTAPGTRAFLDKFEIAAALAIGGIALMPPGDVG